MTNLEWALRYRAAGWSVLPCRYKAPIKEALGKYRGGWEPFKTKLATECQIEQWWGAYPDAQIGVVCGRISNMTVVDFDWLKDEDGVKRPDLSVSVDELAAKLPLTMRSRTGSGGVHKFFKYADIPTSLHTVHPQIDIKNNDSIIILPPSDYGPYQGGHPKYEWDDFFPWSEENLKNMAEIPPILLNHANVKKSAPRDWSKIVAGVRAGERNQNATYFAGKLIRAFAGDPDAAWMALEAWNEKNQPPLDADELEATFKSILKRDYANRPWAYGK